MSHQLSVLTNGKLNLDSFILESLVHVRAVEQGEVRILRTIGNKQVAFLISAGNETRICQLSVSAEHFPLLVLGLDQGSIGSSGSAFSINCLGALVVCRFDKIHRSTRDTKLSLKHCMHGRFLKAQLFSAHVFSVNYKPFGTGGFAQTKQRMLNVFLATETIHSAIWRKYAQLIAKDLNRSCETDAEHQTLFNGLADLASFRNKGNLPKMGRWFSYDESCHDQLPEWHVFQMLLEHHVDDDKDESAADVVVGQANLMAAGKEPTPQAELSAMKKAGGGLKLAAKLMRAPTLFIDTKILYIVTQQLWCWYKDEVVLCKSPEDGLARSILLAQSWQALTGILLFISLLVYLTLMLQPGSDFAVDVALASPHFHS